jgi:O-acetyl-ADP-ribose deacetylase
LTTTLNINGCAIEFVLGDISRQDVDAIVNAANSQLAGGGGVDGAIHRVGGPMIMAETRRRYPDGCPTGSAVITGAGNLNAKYAIHAVGPFWSGGQRGEDQLLSAAYRAALSLATENYCQTVAMPALSTGAYRYPLPDASIVAVATVAAYFREVGDTTTLCLVRFVLCSDAALAAFQRAGNKVAAG